VARHVDTTTRRPAHRPAPRDPLAQDSPSDFVWGARDQDSGYGGLNLLGLMRVGDELIADVRTGLTALAPGR